MNKIPVSSIWGKVTGACWFHTTFKINFVRMKIIEQSLLDKLCNQATSSERLRKNFNLHDELSDTLQRLLNAMQPGTYVQPHKHENPDKREVFSVLQGSILVVCFNDTGEITEHVVLNPAFGKYIVEIPALTWHSVIVLKADTVVFEVKDGPYKPINDKNFAPWAPQEGDIQCKAFNASILKKLQLT
jgi:cupin fold WbuC family metalloprotein